MRHSLTAIAIFVFQILHAQSDKLGTWSVINTKININQKFSVMQELQLRSQSFYNDLFYYEIKGGISYALDKNFSFLVGVGKYVTYTPEDNFEKPITANELRLWQQVTMNQYLTKIKFEHRFRIEQRWFTKEPYRNRYRYRLSVAIPLNAQKIGPGVFYVAGHDEIFLTNKAPYFARNRAFVGAGYQFNKHLTIQPGYMHQFDYRNNIKTAKNFFQLTLLLEVNNRGVVRERIPGTID